MIITAQPGRQKKSLFKKKDKDRMMRSQDDSSLEMLHKIGNTPIRRQASETNLAADFLGSEKGSKMSLMDKFSDVSKSISDKHSKRSKSPFHLFKKPKSRDPSPTSSLDQHRSIPAKMQVSSSEYSEDSEVDSIALGPEISIDPVKTKALKKTMSETSYGSEAQDSDIEFQDIEANMDIIDEYYYGVRIFPGQDPNHVHVGWVTPQYHQCPSEFDMKQIRNVIVCSLDQEYQMKSR